MHRFARQSATMAGFISLCVLGFLVCPPGALAQASKKSAGSSSTIPTMGVEVAFPNLHFDRPVSLAYADDGSNLLFVVEQNGVIWSFPNDSATRDKQVFLDIQERVNRGGNEEGLLGLAFHPKYKENGTFYVYYSAKPPGPRRSVVARFHVSKSDPRRAEPQSEEQIWVSAPDNWDNHNGGCTLFGPDGYLYFSLGDGGAAADPLSTGQNPRDWFASILRIDVDKPAAAKPYGIPPDNPARRDPKQFGHWAPEVYAIGLRNVWKFSFDRETKTLWAGDVGQDTYEMVHIIENGGNYGWSIKEGFHPFQPARRQRPDRGSKISPPVIEYSHSVGKSITGGYVYRGKALPELVGLYVYGDFDSGRIWGLREKEGKALENHELTQPKPGPPLAISSFGEDPAGELFILAFDGRIHRFVTLP
ncbi:MAG TPA: PQQ-dependent sugar dehydrogenase [Isosphaeraceae bacterium]|nr:PQQ-dependent sugar dehydrogenase [Isosphaeraceae bacterium]